MGEKNLDFDRVVDRRGTDCLKYDFAVKRGKPKDILPLWVADMDFPTSSYVQEALIRQAEHGIFGYSDGQEAYFRALQGWFIRRHQWRIEEEWVLRTPGVVFAIAMAVQAFTKEQEAVLIQQPVYYPFSEVIRDNRRRVVSSDLLLREGRYEIDFEDFEETIVREKVKLFVLCSPHNPVGRVWTREELRTLGQICRRHGVIVFSDEIHSDFVFRGEHLVFPSVEEGFEDFSIVATAPSKTFNLAGLQISNIIVQNADLRHRLRKKIDCAGYSQPNAMGLVACRAAYEKGEEWFDHLMEYLRENLDFTRQFVRQYLPDVKLIEPEGTYLVWLDFRGKGLTDALLNEALVNKAGLWLDSGEIFGRTGSGFQRINIACPRSVLGEALERLKRI
ncbi:MAG: MalY/PatB family protein [Acetatifactor sp.]